MRDADLDTDCKCEFPYPAAKPIEGPYCRKCLGDLPKPRCLACYFSPCRCAAGLANKKLTTEDVCES